MPYYSQLRAYEAEVTGRVISDRPNRPATSAPLQSAHLLAWQHFPVFLVVLTNADHIFAFVV